jgi:hypothetical protein
MTPTLWKFKTKLSLIVCVSFVLVCAFNPVVCAQLLLEEYNFKSWGVKCISATSLCRNNFFLLTSLMITVHIIIFVFGRRKVNPSPSFDCNNSFGFYYTPSGVTKKNQRVRCGSQRDPKLYNFFFIND